MLVTSPRTGELGMNLNHPRDPARGLEARQGRLALDTLGRVDGELTRLAWVSFMGITENLSIMVVLEGTVYIMVRIEKESVYTG